MSDELDRFALARLEQIIIAWDEWQRPEATDDEQKAAWSKMQGAIEASRLIAATPESRAHYTDGTEPPPPFAGLTLHTNDA